MIKTLIMFVLLRESRKRFPEMFDGAIAARSVELAIAAWLEEEEQWRLSRGESANPDGRRLD